MVGGHSHSHAHDDGTAHVSVHKLRTGVPRLLALAGGEKLLMLAGVFALLFSTGVTLVVPFAVGVLIDDTDPTSMTSGLLQALGVMTNTTSLTPRARAVQLIWILAVLFCFGAVCTLLRTFLLGLAGERVAMRLRNRLFAAIMTQPVAFFDANRTGELVNRLVADTTLVQTAFTITVGALLRFAIQIVGGVVILLYLSWKLALVMLAPLPIMLIVGVVYGRFVRRLQGSVQSALAGTSTTAEESISLVRHVRAFGKEDTEIEHYTNSTSAVFLLGRRYALFAGVYASSVELLACMNACFIANVLVS